MALVESLHGDGGRDANTHRFLTTCIFESTVSVDVARRAAELRRLARAGPDRCLAAVVDRVGEPVAPIEVDAGDDAGERLGDVIEGVVVVVQDDHEPITAQPLLGAG
jgi:hypothetical protein